MHHAANTSNYYFKSFAKGYFAGSLDRPHCHISRADCKEYCCKFGRLSKQLRRKIRINEFLRDGRTLVLTAMSSMTFPQK